MKIIQMENQTSFSDLLFVYWQIKSYGNKNKKFLFVYWQIKSYGSASQGGGGGHSHI